MRCALVLSRGSYPLSTSYFERRVDDVMPDLVCRKLAFLELIARCVREAVYWQDQLAVDMLLELKADPSTKNSDGETPMDRSVAHHDQMWRRVISRCRAQSRGGCKTLLATGLVRIAVPKLKGVARSLLSFEFRVDFVGCGLSPVCAVSPGLDPAGASS